MPTINPTLVPTIAPGNLFKTLTQDDTLNVRWLTPSDPVFYGTLNRPIVDTVLRQLVLAKSLDLLSLSIGHQAIFPFLVQAKVVSGTGEIDIPAGWIWDLNMSTPSRWQNFRIAKIKRISGYNTAEQYTGILRVIITASQQNSNVEVALFSADYQIDSSLTYQRARLTVVDSNEEKVHISDTERETVSGSVVFRTLDPTDPTTISFYNAVAPAVGATDANSDGYYDAATVYDIASTAAGGVGISSDFSLSGMTHGTGLLVESTNNPIPHMDSDIQSWISALNFPFDSSSALTSTSETNIRIPTGLFREMDITAPAGDEPTGDTTGSFYPVWVDRIQLVGSDNSTLRFYFATHSINENAPSLDIVEFARLDLNKGMTPGQIVEIVPNDNLMAHSGADSELYQQHFGRGHVVLSPLWSGTSSEIDDFFNSVELLASGEAEFLQNATRLSSFAVSRVPKYTPTYGQNQAMLGSTSRLASPIYPSEDNLYVTEKDQGEGNEIDLEAQPGLTPVEGISRYGSTGSLTHKIVKLCLDYSKSNASNTFYDDYVLPRLRVLLGRSPIFGDFWFNGTELFFFNGDTWQS